MKEFTFPYLIYSIFIFYDKTLNLGLKFLELNFFFNFLGWKNFIFKYVTTFILRISECFPLTTFPRVRTRSITLKNKTMQFFIFFCRHFLLYLFFFTFALSLFHGFYPRTDNATTFLIVVMYFIYFSFHHYNILLSFLFPLTKFSKLLKSSK